jgi:hypothetical protein
MLGADEFLKRETSKELAINSAGAIAAERTQGTSGGDPRRPLRYSAREASRTAPITSAS